MGGDCGKGGVGGVGGVRGAERDGREGREGREGRVGGERAGEGQESKEKIGRLTFSLGAAPQGGSADIYTPTICHIPNYRGPILRIEKWRSSTPKSSSFPTWAAESSATIPTSSAAVGASSLPASCMAPSVPEGPETRLLRT